MIPQQHEATTAAARRRGRPVLGGIAGFFLGVFVWLDLILLGIMPLESALGYALPVVGVAAGVGFAMWAPFGGRTSTDDASDGGVSTAGPEDGQPSASMTSDGA